jgi:hypothetical protein
MNTAAIANHLNVAASAIVEVQEWARVLWVRVKGLGARFVSKKVVTMTQQAPQLGDYADFREFEKALIEWRTPSVVEEIAEQYQILSFRDGTFNATVWSWNSPDRGYWATANTCWKLDSLESARQAVLTNHVPHIYRPSNALASVSTIPAGYAVTSTGETVLIEDWDEIEGAM